MFLTERELIKQTITVRRKKYATGLFWQPMGAGNTAHNYAKQLVKKTDKKYNLFTEYKSMVGLANSYNGAYTGMPSAAAEVVNSLSELVSFLGVFIVGKYFYLVAVRNGIIIRDVLIEEEDFARKTYTELMKIPDWSALFAPSSWGIPKSQERNIKDLITNGNFARLHPINVVKSVIPSILIAVLFIVFG
nr:type 4b pilus protein PilO2 [Candidatus Enterousia merdequi]